MHNYVPHHPRPHTNIRLNPKKYCRVSFEAFLLLAMTGWWVPRMSPYPIARRSSSCYCWRIHFNQRQNGFPTVLLTKLLAISKYHCHSVALIRMKMEYSEFSSVFFICWSLPWVILARNYHMTFKSICQFDIQNEWNDRWKSFIPKSINCQTEIFIQLRKESLLA